MPRVRVPSVPQVSTLLMKTLASLPPMVSVTRSVSADRALYCGATTPNWLPAKSFVCAPPHVTSLRVNPFAELITWAALTALWVHNGLEPEAEGRMPEPAL